MRWKMSKLQKHTITHREIGGLEAATGEYYSCKEVDAVIKEMNIDYDDLDKEKDALQLEIVKLKKRVRELEKEHRGKCPVCMAAELPEEQGGPDPDPLL